MLEMELQQLCERGQDELMQTRYLDAARTLALAEQQAWDTKSFDTLSRLYLPLQEARRQIRQRCGEGTVKMHLYAANAANVFDPEQVLQDYPFGQLLVAGWDTIQPAVQIRKLAQERHLFVETFLASAQNESDGKLTIKIFPTENSPPNTICLIMKPEELPADANKGNAETFAGVMSLWERLHTPFLLAARGHADPVGQMQAYRFTLQVDPACELAHQFLADIARSLARARR